MTTNSNPVPQKTNGLRLACRIFGSVIIGLFILMATFEIIEAFSDKGYYFPKEDQLMFILVNASALLLIAGYIISWKKEGLGGALIIVASLTISLPSIIRDGNFNALIVTIPLFASGLLYVIYWRDKRKQQI
jgi:hypothetical protein